MENIVPSPERAARTAREDAWEVGAISDPLVNGLAADPGHAGDVRLRDQLPRGALGDVDTHQLSLDLAGLDVAKIVQIIRRGVNQ
jgi:hypothetical protein